jgi:LemA protein
MDKWLKNPIVWVVVVVIILIMFLAGIYNTLVAKDQNVATNWAQIETQLQRRYDLIPNLVETVKGYAKHEKELFENVAKARSAWASAKTTGEKVAAANNMEGFLGRLIAVAENYPLLQAAPNFRALQDELAGTENRIAVARERFNETVQEYNVYARRVPNVLFVRLFGFDGSKEFFKVKNEAAKEAPKVTF